MSARPGSKPPLVGESFPPDLSAVIGKALSNAGLSKIQFGDFIPPATTEPQQMGHRDTRTAELDLSGSDRRIKRKWSTVKLSGTKKDEAMQIPPRSVVSNIPSMSSMSQEASLQHHMNQKSSSTRATLPQQYANDQKSYKAATKDVTQNCRDMKPQWRDKKGRVGDDAPDLEPSLPRATRLTDSTYSILNSFNSRPIADLVEELSISQEERKNKKLAAVVERDLSYRTAKMNTGAGIDCNRVAPDDIDTLSISNPLTRFPPMGREVPAAQSLTRPRMQSDSLGLRGLPLRSSRPTDTSALAEPVYNTSTKFDGYLRAGLQAADRYRGQTSTLDSDATPAEDAADTVSSCTECWDDEMTPNEDEELAAEVHSLYATDPPSRDSDAAGHRTCPNYVSSNTSALDSKVDIHAEERTLDDLGYDYESSQYISATNKRLQCGYCGITLTTSSVTHCPQCGELSWLPVDSFPSPGAAESKSSSFASETSVQERQPAESPKSYLPSGSDHANTRRKLSEEAMHTLNPQWYSSVDFATPRKRLQKKSGEDAKAEMSSPSVTGNDVGTKTASLSQDFPCAPNGRSSEGLFPWTDKEDGQLLLLKNASNTWSCIAEVLAKDQTECKKRFKQIKPKDWRPKDLEPKKTNQAKLKAEAQTKSLSEKSTNNDWPKPPFVDTPDHSPANNVCGWSVSEKCLHARSPVVDTWGWTIEPERCNMCGQSDLSCQCDSQWNAGPNNDEILDGPTCTGPWGSRSNKATSEPKLASYKPCSVSYWAAIESGGKEIRIPINGRDVSGSEKTIITTGMPEVWKWVYHKGLGDKVSLQDAFDLAQSICEADVWKDHYMGKHPHTTSRLSGRHSRSVSASTTYCPWDRFD